MRTNLSIHTDKDLKRQATEAPLPELYRTHNLHEHHGIILLGMLCGEVQNPRPPCTRTTVKALKMTETTPCPSLKLLVRGRHVWYKDPEGVA